MSYYIVSRGDDGKFHILSARSSYADGPGDFYAIQYYGIISKFDTRKEAEEYLDNTPVKRKQLDFKIG